MVQKSIDFSGRLPQQDQKFLAACSPPLWMPGQATDFARLIVPDPNKPHVVEFPNSDRLMVPEFKVIQAANCIAIKYEDPRNGKRPGDKGFVVIDGRESSKPSLNEGFNLDSAAFVESAHRWLENLELRIIPSQIARNKDAGSFADVAFVAPKGLEWAKLAWDLIHGTPDITRLQESYNPKIIFYVVPGLRDKFDGEQCTMFERCDGGILRIYTNSTYMGLAMSKKPIFVALSHLLQESGGLMCHATMAILEGSDRRKGFIYHAASGHGKTEFGFVREGQVSIGVRSDGSHISLFYPPDYRPAVVVAGDDGVIIRSFRSPNGLGIGENSEKGGLFDRPSSSYKSGDLPGNDALFQGAVGRPFAQLVLNMNAQPGFALETHQRELDNGKLHSNPRHNYTWKDWGDLTINRDQRISHTTNPITFDTSIFGMGVTPQTAVASWLNRLPLCSAYTMMLAGVCKSKSVSVTDAGTHAKHGLKLDRFGTMESFTINEAVDNANRLWEYYKNFNKVEHYVVPIGNVGPNIRAEDNEAEILARNFLFHLDTGEASTEWVPHPCPFFGMIPKDARFFGQEIPPDYSDPSMQFSSRTEFRGACQQVLNLMQDGLADILKHPRLNPQARMAIERALGAPVYIESPKERAELFDRLNRAPMVGAL